MGSVRVLCGSVFVAPSLCSIKLIPLIFQAFVFPLPMVINLEPRSVQDLLLISPFLNCGKQVCGTRFSSFACCMFNSFVCYMCCFIQNNKVALMWAYEGLGDVWCWPFARCYLSAVDIMLYLVDKPCGLHPFEILLNVSQTWRNLSAVYLQE